jgi:hypothetical protein
MDLRRCDAFKLAATALLAALGLKWLDKEGVWSTKPLERAEVWGARLYVFVNAPVNAIRCMRVPSDQTLRRSYQSDSNQTPDTFLLTRPAVNNIVRLRHCLILPISQEMSVLTMH